MKSGATEAGVLNRTVLLSKKKKKAVSELSTKYKSQTRSHKKCVMWYLKMGEHFKKFGFFLFFFN